MLEKIQLLYLMLEHCTLGTHFQNAFPPLGLNQRALEKFGIGQIPSFSITPNTEIERVIIPVNPQILALCGLITDYTQVEFTDVNFGRKHRFNKPIEGTM